MKGRTIGHLPPFIPNAPAEAHLRALIFNASKLDFPKGAASAKLDFEPVSTAALRSVAGILGTNPLLPIFFVLPEQEGAHQDQIALIETLRRDGCKSPLLAFIPSCAAKSVSTSATQMNRALAEQSNLRMQLLNAGADDVLVQGQCGSGEIVARVNSISRRSANLSYNIVEYGELRLFLDGRNPEVAGNPVKLSTKEFDILRILTLRPGQLVTKATIYDALYALTPLPPFEKIIDVYICRLRAKLSKVSPSGANHIETLSGRGYRLRDMANFQALAQAAE